MMRNITFLILMVSAIPVWADELSIYKNKDSEKLLDEPHIHEQELNDTKNQFEKYKEIGNVYENNYSIRNIKEVHETGAIGNVEYSIYIDGTGSFGAKGSIDYETRWMTNCDKDKFNERKMCYMHQKDLFVFLINGSFSVSVGLNQFPRSSCALKIDNNKTLYGVEGQFNNSLGIIEQLKKGKVASTRYQQWPYERNVDEEVTLLGFSEALDFIKMRYKQL